MKISTATILLSATFFLASACGGTKQNDAKDAKDEDTFVPEHTQKRSEENYGAQQGSMDSLSLSPSEQAGANHQHAVDRGRGQERAPEKENE